MIELTAANQQEVLKLPMCVIEFYSPTCNPCKHLSHTMEGIQTDVPIYKCNCFENRDFVNELTKIPMLPTVAFLKKGQVKSQFSGIKAAYEIIAFIENGKMKG